MAVLMGADAELYYGTAGSSAATELSIARDVTINVESDMVEINSRARFINSMKPAGVSVSIEFEVLYDDSVAFLATARGNQEAGTATAFLAKDKTSGTTIIDGDFYIASISQGQPLRDKQTMRITANLTEESRNVVIN